MTIDNKKLFIEKFRCLKCNGIHPTKHDSLNCCVSEKMENIYECTKCKKICADDSEALLCCSSIPTEYYVFNNGQVAHYCDQCNNIGKKSDVDFCCEAEKLKIFGYEL